MSAQEENSIRQWSHKSHTANLEVIDLEDTRKILNHTLAHNIAVTADRVSLSEQVFIKNLKQIHEDILQLIREVESKSMSLKRCSQPLRINKPLTEDLCKILVKLLASQPKLVEERALSLTQEVECKLNRVEQLLHELEICVGQ
ncbi:ORF1 [Chinaberry tree badnavirus 1]|uniref:ORF1 n=1 Tax=Chinaberry tree badnavirus 1 TaxID=2908099 RepID=UPI002481ADCE|nr:ORF1 [Chinaberry tree badnavirus 1]UID85529.1 ORF1 [Chinaberry tree badnavirus 1]